ncbi:hypothetical protein [Marinobacter sp.]|uniref:hypothetical protein n=1 Tax=Marinobacter sp. TaxID=50741 RepID=UPI001B658388|nr:hypothetical protein [Marinobacter sp.]MBQ0834373.1 hypothetical protein [Marinobacter sp.]
MVTRLSALFAAGCLGGLATVLTLWLFGILGISGALGVGLAPPLTPPMIYSFMIWGGIWGFAFLLPLGSLNMFARGLLLSLGPTIVQLLVVFPMKMGVGVLGLDLGTLTPLLVLIFNGVWGLVAAWWLTRQEAGVLVAA